VRALLVVIATAALAATAHASITVSTSAQRPALRVDARGNAEVSWVAAGSRRFLLVPPGGRVFPGGRLRGRDVSRASAAVALPFRRVLRKTPDGRYWALQAWRVLPGRPVELRFSRWRGEPTQVTATAHGDRLDGRVSFHGRGVYGFSRTPEGRRLRIYAYVDCFGCPSAPDVWRRLVGVAPRAPDGRFGLALGPDRQGLRYRISVPGPQLGTTYAPDASVVVERSAIP
jgi:hypothetical protein